MTYEIHLPGDGDVRVTCTDHTEQEEFAPGTGSIAFYCPGCDVEVDLSLRNGDDWRAWDERC